MITLAPAFTARVNFQPCRARRVQETTFSLIMRIEPSEATPVGNLTSEDLDSPIVDEKISAYSIGLLGGLDILLCTNNLAVYTS